MKTGSWFGRLRNTIWPRMGLKRYGRYLLKRIDRMKASAHSIAAGVAAGAAVSMFPLLGFHFILGFILAFLTRGSMLAAALGTAIGNPITFPVIFSATFQIGRSLTPGADSHAEAIMRSNEIEDIIGTMLTQGISGIWPVWKTMMIGAIPISVAVYLVLYVSVRWFVTSSRQQRQQRQLRRSR